METAAIATDAATAAREKLHRFIDTIEDARAISLYEVCKPEMEDEFELPDDVKAELDQMEKDYENGTLETFDWNDVRKETEAYINSKK